MINGPVSLTDVANGILVVIVGLLSWLGINRGRDSKIKEGEHIELAGAIIDNRRADALIDALNRNTEALKASNDLFQDITGDLQEGRAELRALTMELVRRG